MSNSFRTILAVPGSNEKMIEKSRTLSVDHLFLDLEDSVTPNSKELARRIVVNALLQGGFTGNIPLVRINDLESPWWLKDLSKIIQGAGSHINSLIVPKVQSAEQVVQIDAEISKLEREIKLPEGKFKIQVQIESASGVMNLKEIAKASGRLSALVFGPGDFAASIGMQTLHLGDNPVDYAGHDAYHPILMQILVAARANNLLAIDGPYSDISNLEGLTRSAQNSAALGFDGKWVIHPSQIETVNEIFTPRQSVFDESEALLELLEGSTSQGAILFNGKMVDEASRKMAIAIAEKGRAAGMSRSHNAKRDQESKS